MLSYIGKMKLRHLLDSSQYFSTCIKQGENNTGVEITWNDIETLYPNKLDVEIV